MAKEPIVKFVLRVSPEVHRRLKEEAKKANTSMNRLIADHLAEVVQRRSMELQIAKLSRDVAKILKIVEGYDFSD